MTNGTSNIAILMVHEVHDDNLTIVGIPFEHPKNYNKITYDQVNWVSTMIMLFMIWMMMMKNGFVDSIIIMAMKVL